MPHDDTTTTAVEDALAGIEAAPAGAAGRRAALPHLAARPHLTAVGTQERRPGDGRTADGAADTADRPDGADACDRAHDLPAVDRDPADRSTARRSPAGRVDAPATGRPRAASRSRLRLVPAPAPVPTAVAPRPATPPLLAERVRRLVAADRAPVVEPDGERGAAPGTDAGRFAHGVGLACVEVVLGRRPAAQLARWVAPAVLELLHDRADLVRRAGVLAHARRPAARRVRVCRVDAHTAEACLVVDDGVRVRAVALRLEAHRGTWRVTTLEIG